MKDLGGINKKTGFEIGLILLGFSAIIFLYNPNKNSTPRFQTGVASNTSEATPQKMANVTQPVNTAVEDKNLYRIDAELTGFVIDTVVSMASDAFIEKGLSTIMRYSREDLLRVRNVSEFAKNAAKKAMLVDKEQGDGNAGGLPLAFSNTQINTVESVLISNGLVEHAYKISASFDASSYGGPYVIARWYNIDTQALLSFDKQPIKAYAQTQVWLRRNHWQAGRYRVDIFQENDDLTPLAHGSFTVLENAAAANE